MHRALAAVRDFSSNDTSSTTTLRRNFLSNYQFRRNVTLSKAFSSNTTLNLIFSPSSEGQITRSRHAMLGVLIMCLSLEIENFSFKAVSTRVKLETSRLKPLQLLNFRRKFTYTVKIYINRSLIMIYSPNKIVLSYVHCARYIKMDEYSTPEFYKKHTCIEHFFAG